MRSKALTIILLLAVIALFVALSRSAAIRAAERVIADLDPSKKLGFMMSGTSPVLTPERKLLWRVAYFQRDIFTGNPVVIYVSPSDTSRGLNQNSSVKETPTVRKTRPAQTGEAGHT